MIEVEDITRDALSRMEGCQNPRLRTLMAGIIEHLHAFVRDYRPTEDEWMATIDFLTRTGKISTDSRQEFILLSDVLGVSMVLDAVNHRAEGAITDSTVFGPFYSGEQPVLPAGASILKREEPGDAVRFDGTVAGEDGAPIANAKIEVWQTAPSGLYDVQDQAQPQGHLRATFHTDVGGRYAFRTVMPVSYPIPDDGPVGQLLGVLGRHPYRPAHIHFMISAPGYQRLVTHLFIAGDTYLESDAVFGVKPSLIVIPEADGDEKHVRYDFVLAHAAA